ncbi:hypothetical protein RJT34_20174 [Clitoria ternatea]|uniref:Uncharacterized protein n=1 Tax=Clitoria ternatea TaxID=43366 RepID=A0AAN9ISK5_CLITE
MSSSKSENVVNIDKHPRHAADKKFHNDSTATNGVHHFPINAVDMEEVIGIIILEDVFEELSVAAVAAASSVARVPSG